VKTSVTKFILLSATVLTLLGCFTSDSHEAFSVHGIIPGIERPVESIVDAAINTQAQQLEERERKEEELRFNFPNVFNIFRYLF